MQGLDVFADAAAAAVSALHRPGAGPAQLAEAREAYEKARVHPQAHQLAFRLAEARRPPEVQHLGFQVLLSALRAKPPVLNAQDHAEAKAWLVSLLSSDRWATATTAPPSAAQAATGVAGEDATMASAGPATATAGASPAYVRGKCAEAIAELARLDWPEKWPELKPALLAAGAAPVAGLAALALGAWSHLADVVAEDSKEITLQRRRDMKMALATMAEQPSQAPELIASLQRALQQHGADRHVVSEALGVCRAFVNAVPVQVLLQHNLDRIVQVGLEIEELRELAVSALAEWVDCVCPGRGNIPNPAGHDLARFTCLLAKLGRSCRFDGDQQSYAFHRQVAELLADLCASSAASMVYLMGSSEMLDLWRALLHLLRYPSASVQLDVLTGMALLAKAQAGGPPSGTGSPARPPLEELLGPLFIVCLKLDTLPLQELDADRSAWLLRHIGAPSATEMPANFQAWCSLLDQAHCFDIREGESGGEERKQLFGQLKVKVFELLGQICGPSAVGGEGYGALCRLAAQLVLRALAGGWVPEFDAAVSLVERPGPAVLRAVEKKPKEELDAILQPSLAFLQQVTVSTTTFSSSLEYKRIEFLSHWSAFYKHFGTEIVGQVLQRLLALVECRQGPEGAALQMRALDTLVGLGKGGALNPAQLEALNTECGRLAPILPPAARGKLVEALSSAVASCKALEPAQQAQLIWGIMEQATASFRAAELVQPAGAARLAAALATAASAQGAPVSAAGGGGPDEPNLAKLREVRTLLHVFTGVVTKAVIASAGGREDAQAGADAAGPNVHVAGRVVQAWAPGIFAFNDSLSGLPAAMAAVGGAGPVVLSMPAEMELTSMRAAKGEDVKEDLPAGFDARKVQAVRSILWELRGAGCKAARACAACPDFWTMPEACAWLRSLAGGLTAQGPHVAEAALKDVFGPAFGRGGVSPTSRESLSGPQSAATQAQLCSTVVPALLPNLSRLLVSRWGSPGAAASAALEAPLAAATVALSRTASLLLSEMAGAGLPQASLLANPERRLFTQGASAAGAAEAPEAPMETGNNKKRKNRNRNRFAALAEDAEAAAGAAAAAAAPSAPATPSALPGLAAAVLREPGPRDALRQGLVDLLDLPEKDTVQRALVGLAIWSTQLWNLVCRGEHAAAVGLSATQGRAPEAGELLHAAGDALRCFSTGVLKPVTRLIATPPELPQAAGGAAAPRVPVACSAALAAQVQQSWRSYVAATRIHGRAGPSGLVSDATQVVFAVLTVLTRLFKLQCRKLELKCSLEQVYLCPPLFESAQICRGLPNTSEADVENVLKAFIEDHEVTQEHQRSAVRVLLHEASPAFSAEGG